MGKQILISHRGNIDGKKPHLENNPNYINEALRLGYDVEIDVWLINNKWYLGHDNPTYKIKYNFLFDSRFWLHAKNGEVFDKLLKDKNYDFNVFWHTNEDWVLTSKGYIWTYPNKFLYENSDNFYFRKILKVNSVSIHLRRGDFLTNPRAKKLHGVCSMAYYKKSINFIMQKVKNPHFFIFSDDIEWARSNFNFIESLSPCNTLITKM